MGDTVGTLLGEMLTFACQRRVELYIDYALPIHVVFDTCRGGAAQIKEGHQAP
jgi:hypothetical protein